MARVKSPEKRAAILRAAVHEIANVGLAAPTAKIVRALPRARSSPISRASKSCWTSFISRWRARSTPG